MFCYTFILTPSRNKSDIIFTNFKDQFTEAADHINNGLAFRRDGKSIRIDTEKIKEKTMVVVLESKRQLENPARSLSSLTRYLTTNYEKMFRPYVFNKTLFNIKQDPQSSSTDLSDNRMTNEELVKAIIDLLYTQKESKEKEQSVSELKSIVRRFSSRTD